MKMPKVSIIVPVYNESENITPFFFEIKKHCPEDFELIWVDDGSTDSTLLDIQEITRIDERVKCVSLSRNFGHQNAVMAGLDFASGSNVIIMDGNLQHPPFLIPVMLDKLDNGFDMVITRQKNSKTESFFQRLYTKLFYKVLNFLSDTKVQEDIAEFRAFNHKVLDGILQFKEREIFLTGFFTWMGFKSTVIEFEVHEKGSGYNKYSLKKTLHKAVKGGTSFSIKPLRLALFIGMVISFLALGFAIFELLGAWYGNEINSSTSLIIAAMFLGGIQLLLFGLLGKYIASLFVEVKRRPLYLINEVINQN